MLLENKPRTELAFLPTPIEKLTQLSSRGPTILIKRDDLTGLALGGNKTRKLEFLFADALAQKADTIITAGAIQSNHCRQTAAAAAKLGLACELLLYGESPETLEANTLLDYLLGAKIHWTGDKNGPVDLEELSLRVKASGKKPYLIPFGGSNAVGALGYVHAMEEMLEQQKDLERPITHIVFASCSGGTQVGLVVGAKMAGFTGEIIGISIKFDKSNGQEYQERLIDLANATAKNLGSSDRYEADDFTVNYDYASGYGNITSLEREAVFTLARQEGILLDPVYSGRAFGALLDLIQKGYFSPEDTVLFWHTGGSPGLFAAPSLIE